MNFGKKLFTVIWLASAALIVMLVFHAGARKGRGEAHTLMVYCAAGVKPPVLAAATSFEKRYGVKIDLQFGGSGTLLSNIQVARSGDLFLAGDESYINIAREKGVVLESLPLSFMTPVIAVAKGNPKNIQSFSDLLREDVRLALGNPDAASIGKQTQRILAAGGVWDGIKRRVEADGVFKPTVSEIANDVKLGAVDAGIIWDATANQYADIDAVHVTALDAARKRVTVGLLKSSKFPTLALRFARYLNSRESNGIFERMGYVPVDGDAWDWAPEITFFCGSVNRRAVEPIIKAFSQREGVTVNTVYNGCGILTAQMKTIRQGQKGIGFPDVYMACDRYYLDTVEDWFQEAIDISDTPLVIAVPEGNPNNITNINDLVEDGVKVAVGQCDQCTIGVLTRDMLENEGLYLKIQPNIATETATSALLVPAVTTKSVDAAIVYRTDTLADSNRVDSVALHSKRAIAIQPFAIAVSSPHKYLARRLQQSVVNSRDVFERAGFNFRAGAHETR